MPVLTLPLTHPASWSKSTSRWAVHARVTGGPVPSLSRCRVEKDHHDCVLERSSRSLASWNFPSYRVETALPYFQGRQGP